VFEVVNRLVEFFSSGSLPIGRGAAGKRLYDYWKTRSEHLAPGERRRFYLQVLGVPSGDTEAGIVPNHEFPVCWLRFLAAVDAYSRQLDTGRPMPRAGAPAGQEDVRRAAFELAGNVSAHAAGLAGFAAKDVQAQVDQIIPLLSDGEIRSAFGARDMWQVIETVVVTHLGGAAGTVRLRVRAQSGATILGWLARHGNQLPGPRPGVILHPDVIRKKQRGRTASAPSDYDLVNAVEQWLAVAGETDDD
jgi:hypothetical protein